MSGMEMQLAEAQARQAGSGASIGTRSMDRVRTPRARNPERILMMGFRPEESACSPSIDN